MLRARLIAGTVAAVLSMTPSAASAASERRLDVDQDGSVQALSDGIMVLRYLFGLRGDSLVSGAVVGNASAGEIEARIAALGVAGLTDVDGDAQVDALTDGLLILRAAFGFAGADVTNGAVSPQATRSAEAIATRAHRLVTANEVPVAHAGSDQSVTTNTVVTLDGAASSDAEADALTYRFAIVAQPSGSVLIAHDSPASPTASFMPRVAGTYEVELLVTDAFAASNADRITVVVNHLVTASFENCGDGIDNDNNDLIDFADAACAANCDADGDGAKGSQCDGPDIDDFDRLTFPGAPEACGDGVDNDADGDADESCYGGRVALLPEQLTVLSGDVRVFSVTAQDNRDPQVAWVYGVDGIVGGNANDGSLSPLPSAPNAAQFRAPAVSARRTVRLFAQDPADSSRIAEAIVTVIPADNLEIRPASATLALNRNQTFVLGQNVPAVGFVPLTNVRWRVNGIRYGTDEVGRINAAGVYRAPGDFPTVGGIQVSAALSDTGPDLAAAPVRLAQLRLQPDRLVGVDEGPLGQLSGDLVFSDGTVANVAPTDLDFISGEVSIATVDGDGQVALAARTGRTVVRATHKLLLTRDAALIEGRSRVKLRNELRFLSRHTANRGRLNSADPALRGAAIVEFTTPGAVFRIDPLVTFARGQASGTAISAGSANLAYEPQSADLVLYGRAEGLPDLSDKVAAIERETGIVTMGRKSGNGVVTVRFDDGFAQTSADLRVIFTRPVLTVTVNGAPIGAVVEAPITTPFAFALQLKNPVAGGFVDQATLRVRRADGGVFHAVATEDIFTGGAVTQGFLLGSQRRTNELVFHVRLSPRVLAPPPVPVDDAAFSVLPESDADEVFIIDRPEDPGQEPVQVTLRPKKPDLALAACNNQQLPGNRAIVGAGNQVVAVAPSLLGPFSPLGPTAHLAREQVLWEVTSPFGETQQVAIKKQRFLADGRLDFGDGTAIPGLFGVPGSWTIRMLMPSIPGYASNPLLVDAIDASDNVAAAEILPIPRDEPDDPLTPLSNVVGAVELLEAPPDNWVPGEPFDLRFQMYNALGQPRRMGSGEPPEGAADPFTTRGATVLVIAQSVGASRTLSAQVETGEPDASGIVAVRVTPDADADPSAPLIVTYAAVQDFSLRLPIPNQPFAIAQFVNVADRGFKEGCVVLAGHGLIIRPNDLALPTQRFRDAVAGGEMDGSGFDDKMRFVLGGGPHFARELAAGVRSVDLGPDLDLESMEVDGNQLKVVARSSQATAAGNREILLRLEPTDGRSEPTLWRGFALLVGARVEATDDHSDKNLPLNADHHGGHPIGSQVFDAEPTDSFASRALSLRMTVTLLPSLGAGDQFRGIDVDQPIIAFAREHDPDNDAIVMTGLQQEVALNVNAGSFLVYGNTTDRYRLDSANRLCFTGPQLDRCARDPDLLPDYVSPAADAERMVMSIGGNVLDMTRFAAYNLTTKQNAALVVEQLEFDQLRSGAFTADEVRARYAGPKPQVTANGIANINTELLDVVAARNAPISATVYVDNESAAPGLSARRNILNSQYYAGILDQMFLEREQGYGTVNVDTRSRMHAFDGDRDRRPFAVTGVTRVPFGIELDGVIYDPTLFGLDEPANGVDLLGVPIVTQLLGANATTGANRTADGLLRDQGGSSGGYIDLDPFRVAAHQVVAKTPAFEFPGVPGGYGVERRPDELFENCRGDFSAANDIDDVVLPRPRGPGTRVGGPKTSTSALFDCPVDVDSRRVLVMGGDRDARGPVTSSVQTLTQRLITTDPPGLEDIRFRAALYLRERIPARPEDQVALIATTRSDGNEGLVKTLYDQTIDIAGSLATSLYLGALSGGSYFAACGSSVLKDLGVDVGFGLITTGISALESDVVRSRVDLPTSQLEFIKAANGVLQDGVAPIGGNIEVSARDLGNVIYRQLEPEELQDVRLVRDFERGQVLLTDLEKLAVCSLVKAPFEQVKSMLQDQLSIESLGGNGAAASIGMKSATMMIPADSVRSGGVAALTVQTSRSAEILPIDSIAVALTDLPIPVAFKPSATDVSDVDLLGMAMRVASNTSASEADRVGAQRLLNAARVRGLMREPGDEHDEAFEEYRLRFSPMPLLEGVMAPKALLDSGSRVVDFELVTGQTQIPVVTATLGAASRTNENAGARAVLTSEGFELLVIKGQIPRTP